MKPYFNKMPFHKEKTTLIDIRFMNIYVISLYLHYSNSFKCFYITVGILNVFVTIFLTKPEYKKSTLLEKMSSHVQHK